MRTLRHNTQRGVFLLEALIGIVIFAIGALAIIALQAVAVAAQSDAQNRIEAANLADRMQGLIALNVDRTSDTTIQTSLAGFAHLQTTSGPCNFTGTASANADVTNWVNTITTAAGTRLPGSTATMQQIQVNTGTFNQVIITICWQGSNDAIARRHSLVSYIN